jgi:hypothetical protein
VCCNLKHFFAGIYLKHFLAGTFVHIHIYFLSVPRKESLNACDPFTFLLCCCSSQIISIKTHCFLYFYLCNLFCDWCVLKSMLRDHLWEQQQQWNSYRQKEIDNLQLSYMSIICFLSTHVNIFKLLNHVLYGTLRIGFVVEFIDSQVITCHELTIFTFCMQGLLFAPEFWWPIVTPHWGREFLTCFFLYVSSKFHEYLHLYM